MDDSDLLEPRYTPKNDIPDIKARIALVWDRLTPSERRVAATLRFEPDILLIRSSAEIAASCRTSKATVSRLFRALGFGGSIEIRDAILAARGSGMVKKQSRAAFSEQRDLEGRNVDAAFTSLDRTGRPGLAQAIVAARTVLVIGQGGAMAPGLQLRAHLGQVRPDVRFGPIPGQGLENEIVDLAANDVVIVVSIHPHVPTTNAVIDACVASGATVLVIGDPTAAVMAIHAKSAVICPIDLPGGFDGLAPLYSILTAISNDACSAAGPAGAARMARIAAVRQSITSPS